MTVTTQQFPSRAIYSPPQACWFGSEDAPMTGWYHPAKIREAGGSRQCGVILCPPFGHEYMVSYLSYKHLAHQLAKVGFDVFFFDYNGTGDSADKNGDKIIVWQENIRQASGYLKSIAKVDHIVLFGVRLGGLLAASVASEINAAGLVLAAPVISGRAYCRELLILRGTGNIQVDEKNASRSVTDDELTGYEFSAETRHSLSKLDLLKHTAPDCPVLIFARDDVAGQERKLADTWQHNEQRPVLSESAGYAAMMTHDADQTTVPLRLWQECTDWLMSHFALNDQCSSIRTETKLKTSALIDTKNTTVEELIAFDGLVGVVSYCKNKDILQFPAVILSNVGANHRVGNHRLYVTLARSLAHAGFLVLRYDKSGIGYSKITPDERENDVHNPVGVIDVKMAMDTMMSRFSANSFVLMGLCSGAYFSYLTAIEDDRVRVLVLMNQLTYQWNSSTSIDEKKGRSIKSTQFYLRAVSNFNTWKRLILGRLDMKNISYNLTLRMMRKLEGRFSKSISSFTKNTYTLNAVARHFQSIKNRGTELLFIFDANDGALDLMNEKLGSDASYLGTGDHVHIVVLDGVDHTFTPRWAQTYLANFIPQFLQERCCRNKKIECSNMNQVQKVYPAIKN